MSAFLREHVPNSCSILRGIGRRPKHSSPAQVGPTRETTSSHLLSIDSRIPSSSRWSTILFHVQLVFILRGPLNPLRKRTNHEAKHTKPYDSFPNQKSVDSHHNSKSSIVCTNCFSAICKPIRISDPEILVYWTYQEWEGSVRLPVGDTPRPSLTSITRIRILSPLHSVTHISYRLLTFECGIPYILSINPRWPTLH